MIGELDLQDLVPGSLARLFNAGCLAVVVRCPDLVAALWRDLLENPEERMPWESPLVDIARNYHGDRDITKSLGDLFYFQPGRHGYIARKMALTCTDGERGVAVQPPSFVQGRQQYSPTQPVLDRCWSTGQRLMAALVPEGKPPVPFKVVVQRLKYQERFSDFGQLQALARNSLGRWGRAGCALDKERERAAGMLSPRGISDLYGLLAHVPAVGRLMQWVNTMLQRHDRSRSIGAEQHLIEAAHYDNRFFTALCGRRDRIVTQIFDGDAWVDLPIGLTEFAVFPGTLSAKSYGVPPVLHRVVHVGEARASDAPDLRTDNVTLLIGSS